MSHHDLPDAREAPMPEKSHHHFGRCCIRGAKSDAGAREAARAAERAAAKRKGQLPTSVTVRGNRMTIQHRGACPVTLPEPAEPAREDLSHVHMNSWCFPRATYTAAEQAYRDLSARGAAGETIPSAGHVSVDGKRVAYRHADACYAQQDER